MITLLLLPFFLASRVSVDVDSWYYGPEYTYLVDVNLSHVTIDEGHTAVPTRAFHVSSTLKCRPRVPDTLNCRFAAAKMGAFEEGLADLGQDIVEDWEMDEEPFQIKFDRYGVYGLVVTETMTPWAIDAIKSIVNQLNFGVDLRKRPEGEFVGMEMSYIGECEAAIEVTRRPSNEDPGWKDDIFEIVPMAGFSKASGEIVELRKTRDLTTCRHKKNYFFGSKQARRALLPAMEPEPVIISSVSHIYISDSNFTSYTANEVIIRNARKNRDIRLYEKITLWLDSVSPSKVEFPKIPNPAVDTFFLYRQLDDSLPNEHVYYTVGSD